MILHRFPLYAGILPAALLGGLGDAGAARAQAVAGAAATGTAEPAAPVRMVAPPDRFAILAIDVVGATALSQRQVEDVVYPFMGPDRTTADVEAARKALQEAYVKAGYEAVVVEVPPQPQEEFAAGLVRIAVAEAPVAKVTVTGSKHHSAAAVLRQMPSVRSGAPLDFHALQSDLAAANRFPDREIEPAFDAGEQPGTIDVNLKVRDSFPLHASATLNNDNSPNTTPLRATGSLRYTNLWGAGHSVTIGYSVAPQNRRDIEAIFASYLLPFGGSDWSLLLSGYRSNSNVAALGGTNVLGNGYQAGGQAIYRLPVKSGYQALHFGLDFKDFKQNIGLAGTTITSAPIRYLAGNVGYDMTVVHDRWTLDLGLSSTFGLRVMRRIGCFDAGNVTCVPEDQFTNREIDSTENFAHANLDATLTAKVTGDWVAVLRFSGQYSDSHLVSNEQFALGGLSTVRGYFQSEAVGDRGMLGSLEVRGPSLATRIGTFVDDLRLYALVDGGKVWTVNPLPSAPGSTMIASYGAGLRLKLFGRLSGDVLVAVPLRSTTDTRRNDARVTFEVKGEL